MKSIRWRVAKRLSYIQDAQGLKVNPKACSITVQRSMLNVNKNKHTNTQYISLK